jgi:chromosome segregation ATPase
MSAMFGNKKAKRPRIPISKDNIKKAIKKANDKLKSENNRIQDSISTSKDNLKVVQSEIKQASKELERMTVIIDSRISECNAAEAQLFSTKDGLSSLTEKFNKELNIEESLSYSVDQLTKKESKLNKAVNILEEKKADTCSIELNLKNVKQEYDQVKKDLSNMESDLDNAKKDMHALTISKDIVQEEYDRESEKLGKLKSEISSEIKSAEIMLSEKKDYFQSETTRLDRLIAERIEEFTDNTELVNHKNKEYQMIATQVITAENKIAHAEIKAKQVVDNQQIQIDRIKDQFQIWKVTQLDQVAKLKIKGKIDNIDKAGLRDLLDV